MPEQPLQPPKLLDQVRTTIRLRGMSYRTEKAYADWIKRFIIFHNKRHPKEMGAMEIRDFLAHLVNDRNVAPSTQNQALHALLFLYREVLQIELPVITVQELLGHADVSTTMVYTHVLNAGGLGVRSPLDRL